MDASLENVTRVETQFLKELDKKLWTAADKLGANLDAAELADQFAESTKLEKVIGKNMKALGFELPKGGAK